MNRGNMPPKDGGTNGRYNSGSFGEPEIKRTYSPEEAGHGNHRKPVSRYRRRRRTPPNPGVLLAIILFAAIVVICIFFIASGRSKPTGTVPQSGTAYSDAATDSATTDDGLDYCTVQIPHEQLYYGDLILVNFAHEYKFPIEAESRIVTISENKNDHYVLSSYSTELLDTTVSKLNTLTDAFFAATGFESLQVNSAYRSFDDQTSLYAEYEETYGEEYAKSYVATPGFSEHHTGLALDLNVNIAGDGIHYIGDYEGCAWFRENCENYGFVLRYPEDKVAMTSISYESWHYRYVGVPHAQIMEQMNYCLEEYTDYLRTFTYDGTRLNYTDTGGAVAVPVGQDVTDGVMIYYVEASADGDTDVKIPKNSDYTISGNNVDGFIVTAVIAD